MEKIIVKTLLLPLKIIVYPITVALHIFFGEPCIFFGHSTNIEHIQILEKNLLKNK